MKTKFKLSGRHILSALLCLLMAVTALPMEGVPVIKENTCCWFLCQVRAKLPAELVLSHLQDAQKVLCG